MLTIENIFIFYFFIISSIIGYGFFIYNIVGKSLSSKNIGYLGLTAIFFFSIYSYFTSLFIKHGAYHNLIFLGLGFILFLIKIRPSLLKPFLFITALSSGNLNILGFGLPS